MIPTSVTAALVVGYLIGCWRPVRRARTWACWKVWVGKDPGRLRGAAIIALLPERFAPLLWHRVRRGRYPDRPRRRPAPALVNRRHDNEESR